jgi:tRNA(Ile)-lysidine synthase
MDLLNAFKDFITKEHLFSPGDHLLLAVSGGLDSVVLTALCHQAGLDFTIAHCNFQLRGAESDRDEQFVHQLATRYGKEVLVKKFDTEAYAAANKLSIQVAARELRYDWFREILDSRPPLALSGAPPSTTLSRHFVVTAHHLDDNIETLLMNFFKGTGITGLRAMLPRQGRILRPLLFASRADLEQFASDQGLTWVEDSSNRSDKYTRNYFRHQVIPLVQQVYPAALFNLADNIGRFREIELIYRQAIEQQKKKLLEYKGSEIHIPALKLKRSEPLPTLVHEIITPFGFSPQQAAAVIGLLDSESGKYVLSATHRILKNRNWLIISSRSTTEEATILIEAGDAEVTYAQGALRLQQLPLEPASLQSIPPPPLSSQPLSASRIPAAALAQTSIAWLDAAQIEFPLLLRKWQPGDYFYPLGMRKKKKLGRFFIDNKLSLADKEKIWVVEMNKKIIWIVGLRIDDRFRITPGTRQVLKIELSEPGLA